MPIERRRKLSATGMAKRSFRRVSEGQDVRSERPPLGPAASPPRPPRPPPRRFGNDPRTPPEPPW